MAHEANEILSKSSGDRSVLVGVFDWLAVLVAFVVVMLFAVRPVGNADLGYHLAFGEHLWQTGEIVDRSDFIYTIDRETTTLGPGEWWGSDGVMHFVSTNWGTQVVMWWFYDNWGFDGLLVLRMILVACIFGLLAWLCVRLGMPASLGGAVMLLSCLAGYERFYVRPELFTYVMMLCDLHIVLGLYMGRREILSWKKIVALGIVQIFMVNMHSFFLLGWMIVALPMFEVLAVWAWRKWRGGDVVQCVAVIRRMCVALGVVVMVSFVSPWPLRMFIFPFEMLLYLRNATPGSENPMSNVGELLGPFERSSWNWTFILRCYVISLAVVAAGIFCGLFRRHWAMVVLMGLMVAQSLTMRRNILASCIVMLPIAVACIWQLLGPIKSRIRNRVTLIICAVVILAGIAVGDMVVTNRIYFSDRRMLCFSSGKASIRMPVKAAAWINEYQPVGRIWSDFDSSSNVMFFITPHPDSCASTNTMTCPPSSMLENQQYVSGKRPFEEACEKYGLQVVVLHSSDFNRPLLEKLTYDKKFSLVDLDAKYALFVRNDGPNAILAREKQITPENFDVKKYITYIRTLDKSKPTWPMQVGGVTLERMGWYDQAAEVFRAVIAENKNLPEAYFELGATLALRGMKYEAAGKKKEALQDFREARDCFVKTLDLNPSFTYATHNLRLASEDIQRLEILTGEK